MTTRDEIVDDSGLIGLLFVFVFGYFSAALPSILAVLDLPRPDVAVDRAALRSRVQANRIVVRALLALELSVLAWLSPLTVDSVQEVPWSPFHTLGVGLLLLDLMLVTLVGTTLWLLGRLRRRTRQLT